MRLDSFDSKQIKTALASVGLRLKIGFLTLKLKSDVSEFADSLRILYGRYPASCDDGIFDFDLSVCHTSILRQYFRRSVSFGLSGNHPFMPMPPDHAHALFEWGLNWTVGANAHNYLILHSAVLERRGKGVMLSAVSGSGKSTLAAELCLRGWRLLSDEMALLDSSLQLSGLPRPVSLKNSAIDVICRRHPNALFGPPARDTHKGTIAHLVVPAPSVLAAVEPAIPSLIVIPKWVDNAPLTVEPVGPGELAMHLIDQSFNYSILGRDGFNRLTALVQQAPAWSIEYSALDDAVDALESLVIDNG